jgi:hypothetical protein
MMRPVLERTDMPARSLFTLVAACAALSLPLAAGADDGGAADADGGVEVCTEPDGVGNEGYQSAYDWDDDGILDWDDNCPRGYDPSAYDVDGDGVGDVCDNCPAYPNPDQLDQDRDGNGDACDNDADGDAVLNAVDNCPLAFNPNQEDMDGDGLGDACDPDIDGDGFPNEIDPCPYDATAEYGPTCNADPDGDGFPTFNLKTPENAINDNCPYMYNPDQADLDEDDLGDACDPDVDGDGVLDPSDNCPRDYNPDQEDADRDGIGDVCDDAFCYVVAGEADTCIDPGATFMVLAPDELDVDTGDTVRLRLFANREDARIAYSWSLVSGPTSSGLSHPTGEVACSTPFEYHYVEGEEPIFEPLEPGTYTVELHATLLDDPASPTATDTMTIRTYGVVLGTSDTCNCSLVGADRARGSKGFALLLAALALLGAICLFRAR